MSTKQMETSTFDSHEGWHFQKHISSGHYGVDDKLNVVAQELLWNVF